MELKLKQRGVNIFDEKPEWKNSQKRENNRKNITKKLLSRSSSKTRVSHKRDGVFFGKVDTER